MTEKINVTKKKKKRKDLRVTRQIFGSGRGAGARQLAGAALGCDRFGLCLKTREMA